ncbi:MAG: hypothetical protein JXC36_04590, partial [Candidatus Atribacteria bacterium]|nr:hypothetical protein [Candidatus Atribacteria bacterium]
GKQWKKGFSARSLAHSWEEAKGFPKEVRELFQRSKCLALEDLELPLALPEYKVLLPGGKRASQNDIFVLAGNSAGLAVIAVKEKLIRRPPKKISVIFEEILKNFYICLFPFLLKEILKVIFHKIF